jgi:hypothetical protein
MRHAAVETSTTLQKEYLPISTKDTQEIHYYECKCKCGIVANVAAVSRRALHSEDVYITVKHNMC